MSDNDTPMARIMGRWPGDETDAEIEKELAELQPRKNMSQRNLPEELRQLQMASPDCGVVYNGKSAEEWYTLYCQEVRRNDDITNGIVAKQEWTDGDQARAESWDAQREEIARKLLEDIKLPSRQRGT